MPRVLARIFGRTVVFPFSIRTHSRTNPVSWQTRHFETECLDSPFSQPTSKQYRGALIFSGAGRLEAAIQQKRARTKRARPTTSNLSLLCDGVKVMAPAPPWLRRIEHRIPNCRTANFRDVTPYYSVCANLNLAWDFRAMKASRGPLPSYIKSHA